MKKCSFSSMCSFMQIVEVFLPHSFTCFSLHSALLATALPLLPPPHSGLNIHILPKFFPQLLYQNPGSYTGLFSLPSPSVCYHLNPVASTPKEAEQGELALFQSLAIWRQAGPTSSPRKHGTHVHQVSDAIQPSHPWSSPSPPAPNPSQHQSLFQ